jgi:hypothetical protein
LKKLIYKTQEKEYVFQTDGQTVGQGICSKVYMETIKYLKVLKHFGELPGSHFLSSSSLIRLSKKYFTCYLSFSFSVKGVQ